MTRVLVVEHEANAGVGLVGERIAAARGEAVIVGPDTGIPIPESAVGYDAVVVLGGTPGPTDDEEAPWLPPVRALIADCLAREVPYLGICLGAQLLAVVAGGTVGPARKGAEIGVTTIMKTDAAADDPLLAHMPANARALQWHFLEVQTLPPGSRSLASSSQCENQAFRVGPAAWGLQFHLEALTATAETWASEGDYELRSLGLTAKQVIAPVREQERGLRVTWSRIADRWIALVAGAREQASKPAEDAAEAGAPAR
ncbi:type 1 glutamine amidotransferase [Ruicaihuangia caeni]|uniref:type 1 glutamine amidotransferase n=1 Tax=Ruicaihuangia caeni TaxID=3042517 RepID=UPI00338DBCAD